MSVTASISNALSGLTAAARAAELVSANVANASTEGYGTRNLKTSAASVGGVGAGVRIDGVTRSIDQAVLADRRAADADLFFDSNVASYHARIQSAIGLPGEDGSLADVLVGFESALVDAASRPDQAVRLDAVAAAAVSLAQKMNSVSDAVQAERQAAETEILRQVENLNTDLRQVADLNADIAVQKARGNDALALMDQRQVVIDRISGVVPVSVLPRDSGQVALISSGGGVLLDGTAATLGFTPVNMIGPEMTVSGGALSQVTFNGQPVDMARTTNMLQGGALDALFSIRDDLSLATQEALDGLATEVLTRFSDPAVDASLSFGMPGIFTDAGAAFDPALATGLSQRIAVNVSIDPAIGGQSWRLRDGIGAANPGSPGDARQLRAFIDTLSEARVPASSALGSEEQSIFAISSHVLSQTGLASQRAEQQLAFSTARWEALRVVELEGAVNTDAEMQKLLLIEQAYAANARVLESINEMLDALTRI
ncbi:MAG: flagellar hook-associated protein FlgK [Roseobacter sp.]|jgi:flagellar hook-associated protein 1 FlgK|nr:flagellar hook-associated protein FlgK [Roseobacter sp.]